MPAESLDRREDHDGDGGPRVGAPISARIPNPRPRGAGIATGIEREAACGRSAAPCRCPSTPRNPPGALTAQERRATAAVAAAILTAAPSVASCTAAQVSAAASLRRRPLWALSTVPRSPAAASDSMPRTVRRGMGRGCHDRGAIIGGEALQHAADTIMAGADRAHGGRAGGAPSATRSAR